MTCVVLQPSYIPWRGYFHLIQKSDVFVFYDDVQYDKHGWRNRNRIKTSQGAIWLTIPVLASGTRDGLLIKDVRTDSSRDWLRKHWLTLKLNYGHAPFFERYAALIEPYYRRPQERLAEFTIDLTITLSEALGINHVRFLRSSTLDARGSKTDRLVDILSKVGATHYVSGPSARAYLEEDKLRRAGIGLEYINYDYAPYEQLYPPYDAQVSILDLLFMTGPDAPRHVWGG
jgi:hypothetical protein